MMICCFSPFRKPFDPFGQTCVICFKSMTQPVNRPIESGPLCMAFPIGGVHVSSSKCAGSKTIALPNHEASIAFSLAHQEPVFRAASLVGNSTFRHRVEERSTENVGNASVLANSRPSNTTPAARMSRNCSGDTPLCNVDKFIARSMSIEFFENSFPGKPTKSSSWTASLSRTLRGQISPVRPLSASVSKNVMNQQDVL